MSNSTRCIPWERHGFFIVLLALMSGVVSTVVCAQGTTVLVNADIVTMDPGNPDATAMAWSDKQIIAVGNENDVRKAAGENADVIDLEGRTVTPGFIESHDHVFVSSATVELTDVTPFTTPTLAEALEKIGMAEVNDEGWILAFGADQGLYEEQAGPTRDKLDKLWPDTPVLVYHLSGHGGFANSKALEIAGVDESTPDPGGGSLERDSSGRLTGYLAGQPALFLVKGYPTPDLSSTKIAAEQRAAKGITTASEFAVLNGGVRDLLVALTSADDFPTRIVGGRFFDAPDLDKMIPTLKASENSLLRFQFIKTYTDGSLQGGTAYLLDGYYDPDMGEGDGARGSQDEFNRQVLSIYEQGYWPAIHANGDGAVELALNAIEFAQRSTGEGVDSGMRPQIIHAQITRPEQILRMAELGVNPTFFITHVYYWGDLHATKSVGPDLAERMSAMGEAFDAGIPASMHNDPPVSPADPILNMWIAVNRESRTGKVYGAEQAITAEQALAAYTINAAYQFGLEKETGSLEVGKKADFVILDNNPLTAEPADIRDIKVLATVLDGRQTYSDGVKLQ